MPSLSAWLDFGETQTICQLFKQQLSICSWFCRADEHASELQILHWDSTFSAISKLCSMSLPHTGPDGLLGVPCQVAPVPSVPTGKMRSRSVCIHGYCFFSGFNRHVLVLWRNWSNLVFRSPVFLSQEEADEYNVCMPQDSCNMLLCRGSWKLEDNADVTPCT